MTVQGITLIVTILIFVVTMIINSINTFIERKKRWYIEVVVGQSLDLISVFYEELLIKFKTNKKSLKESESQLVLNDFLVLKALKSQELDEIKNKFNFKLLPVFESFDKNLSLKLKENLLSFQDIYTEGLESESELTELVYGLEQSKRDFYEVLYSPIKESQYLKTISQTIILFLSMIGIIILTFIAIYAEEILLFLKFINT
jgi:hypothetical protein